MLLPLFTRNLTIGMSGYDVQCLQKFLKWKGFFIGDTSQFFGLKTRASLASFQKAYGITPAVGFLGNFSKGVVNNLIN